MTAWQIYWLTRLEAFCALWMVGLVLGLLAAILPLPIIFESSPGETERLVALRVVKGGVVALILSLCGLVFVPTTKEAAAIAILPRIANSETVAEIGVEAKTLALEWLKELHPKGEGK